MGKCNILKTCVHNTLESLLLEEKPWRVDITGKFARAPMQAKVTWVRPKDVPEIQIDIETGKIEVGANLDWMGIAKGINANVGSMRVVATARGRNQLELMTRSDFEYTLNMPIRLLPGEQENLQIFQQVTLKSHKTCQENHNILKSIIKSDHQGRCT